MIRKIKQVAWIAGGQVVSLLCNFMLLKILTNSLSASSFGYYSLWMSLTLFIRQVVYDPVSIVAAKESVNNKFLSVNGLNGFRVINYMADKIVLISIFVLLICYFVDFKIIKVGESWILIVAGVIYLVSNGAQGIYLNMLNANKRRKLAGIGVGADSAVKVFLVGMAVLIFENNIEIAIQSIALSSFLVYFGLRYFINKNYPSNRLDGSVLINASKKLFFLSIPFLIPCSLIAIKAAGDKWFMAALLGVEELGAYGVLLQVGFIPFVLFIGVIQTYVAPDIYRLSAIGNKKEGRAFINYINSILVKIFAFAFVAVCVSVIMSDVIFEFLIGPKYTSYSQFLAFFAAAGSLSAASGLVQVAVIGSFNAKTAAWLMFVSVLIGLITTIVAILFYGFFGGVVSLIISNLVSLLIFYISIFVYRGIKQE